MIEPFPLKIEEEDGSPTGFPHTLKVTNGTLTDNGDGTFSLSIGAGGGNTLDQAYDEGGAGAGRSITADSGSVAITGPSGTGRALDVISTAGTVTDGVAYIDTQMNTGHSLAIVNTAGTSHTAGGPLTLIEEGLSGSNAYLLGGRQDGDGMGLLVDVNGAGTAIKIDSEATANPAINVDIVDGDAHIRLTGDSGNTSPTEGDLWRESDGVKYYDGSYEHNLTNTTRVCGYPASTAETSLGQSLSISGVSITVTRTTNGSGLRYTSSTVNTGVNVSADVFFFFPIPHDLHGRNVRLRSGTFYYALASGGFLDENELYKIDISSDTKTSIDNDTVDITAGTSHSFSSLASEITGATQTIGVRLKIGKLAGNNMLDITIYGFDFEYDTDA